MKLQLAYKVAGEDRAKLFDFLGRVVRTLELCGHEVYCPILDSENDCIGDTLDHLKHQNALMVIARREELSEGMLLEAGATYGMRKRLILAVKEGLGYKHTRSLANTTIEFRDDSDLIAKLRDLK